MGYLFGLIISLVLGWLLVEALAARFGRISFFLKLFLGLGIGLGLSGSIVFYTFLAFDQYTRWAILAGHALAIGALALWRFLQTQKTRQNFLVLESPSRNEWLGFLAIMTLIVPLWVQGHLYPYGGWDAWSCWNLKGMFLYNGGTEWRNMFDPLMWRSNTHYPFLLPLINVFHWSFYKEAVNVVPLYNSITIPIATAGVLFFGLKEITKKDIIILPVLAVASLPFYLKLAASQYSDMMLGFYLLATIVCLTIACQQNNLLFTLLSGLCVGLLSFNKTEGLLAAGIIFMLSLPYFHFALSNTAERNKHIPLFVIALGLAALPTVLFKLLLCPPSVTFINGLTSTDKPSTHLRTQWIFAFSGVEFVHMKWRGLWIILLAGALASFGKSFGRALWIVPAFLAIYLGMALIYYYVNTFFEIAWWLSVTLNRVLYAILPLMAFWTSAGLWMDNKK